MKRISILLASATAFVVWTAVPALAGVCVGSGCVKPNGPAVSGTGGVGGTAFTGANVSTGMLLFAALVVVGALALFASRRRIASTQ
jgi:hypothetical protein